MRKGVEDISPRFAMTKSPPGKSIFSEELAKPG